MSSLRVLRTGLERARIPRMGGSSSSSSRRDGLAVWKTARYSTSPDDHHPTSSRPPKLYTTRASVEEALKSSRYAALAASGWRVVHPHDHPLPLVALQKQFHPRLPFRSWNHILDWLHLHLRPVTDELDVRHLFVSLPFISPGLYPSTDNLLLFRLTLL
jgi:hypothetical protein